MHYYTVILKVKNEVGVLARITIMLRKYRVNIRSLVVAPIDEDDRFSNLHMVLESDRHSIEVVLKKLERLIPVLEAKIE